MHNIHNTHSFETEQDMVGIIIDEGEFDPNVSELDPLENWELIVALRNSNILAIKEGAMYGIRTTMRQITNIRWSTTMAEMDRMSDKKIFYRDIQGFQAFQDSAMEIEDVMIDVLRDLRRWAQ